MADGAANIRMSISGFLPAETAVLGLAGVLVFLFVGVRLNDVRVKREQQLEARERTAAVDTYRKALERKSTNRMPLAAAAHSRPSLGPSAAELAAEGTLPSSPSGTDTPAPTPR